ncbi:MAG: alginate export family protein, partial [Chitinophagaceae bacterium]
WQVDLGLAFNQNTDAVGFTGTNYLPANVAPYVKNSLGFLVPTPAGLLPMAPAGNAANNSSKAGSPVWLNAPNTNGANQQYKTFISLYINKKFKKTTFSALLFNDNFGHYKIDSVGSNTAGYVYGKRFVSSGSTDTFDYHNNSNRYTYGFMFNHILVNEAGFGKIILQGAYYAQRGQNREGSKMGNAFHFMAMATYQKGKISITPGYELLSGNEAVTSKDEKFDPLYGTPHKHWGYMDYFYVGTGSPAGGLKNAFTKIKYFGNSLSVGADIHFFSLEKNMRKADGNYIDKKLGNELDFLLNYNMNRFTQIELGFSIMNASSSMPIAKGQADTDMGARMYDKTATWFYAMIKFSLEYLSVKPSTAKP